MLLKEKRSEQALVTVLSVDTVGSTRLIGDREPDDARAALDLIRQHIESVVTANGGVLVSFSGDGGLAIFGWPVSMENHADLAYGAATEIAGSQQVLLPEGWEAPFSPRFRLGIHSGLVGFRELELASGALLDPVGSVVHIAAHLQKAAAPGTVLVSSATRQLMREATVDMLEEVEPPDGVVDEPVYRASRNSRDAAPGDAFAGAGPRLVGRQDELARLLAAAQDRRDQPFFAAVLGEPGIGKSRISGEFARSAASRFEGLAVHSAIGDGLAQATPYRVMAQLLRSAIDPFAFSDAEVAGGIADRGLAREEVEAALSILLPSDDGERRNWTPAQLQKNLVNAFFKLSLPPHGLILIDDYHLVDRESRECIRQASRMGGSQWMILVAARTEAQSELDGLCQLSLQLQPLPEPEMVELADILCERASLEPASVESAIARAEGVPLILEQIVATLKTGARDSELKLPHGIHSMVHARLQLVSPEAKLLAQSLSLLGGKAEFGVLAHMMADTSPDIEGPIDELAAFSILDPRQRGQVAFRHAIVADACATTIPRKRREQLHMAAIDAIEGQAAARPQDLERLAHHAEAAKLTQRALDYLWQAALYARRTGAIDSLSAIFSNAVRLCTARATRDPVRYVDFVLMACTMLLQGGKFTLAKEHLARAAELAETQRRPAKVSAALANMATIDWFEGRNREAETHATRALELARRIDHLPVIVAAHIALANAFHGQGRMSEAIEVARDLCIVLSGDLERKRLGAAATASVMARAFLAWFLADTDAAGEGRDEARQALDLARELDDQYGQALALSSLGSTLLALDDAAAAAECFRAGLGLCVQREFHTIIPSLAGRLASSMTRLGQAKEGLALVASHDDPELRDRTGMAESIYFHCGRGEALCGCGRFDEGLAAIDEAIGLARMIDNPGLVARGLAVRIRALEMQEAGNPELGVHRSELEALCLRYGLAIG